MEFPAKSFLSSNLGWGSLGPMKKKAFFWFRRDLRLEDNHGLYQALTSGFSIIPIFIFDKKILSKLPDSNDRRVQFIHSTLLDLQNHLRQMGSELIVRFGDPREVFEQLIGEHAVDGIFLNRDHDPYPLQRDREIHQLFVEKRGLFFKDFQDHFIFERNQVLKDNGTPYTVFTPYSKKWLASLQQSPEASKHWKSESEGASFCKDLQKREILSLKDLGFQGTTWTAPRPLLSKNMLARYEVHRSDIFDDESTSHLGIHLRFGTISPREALRQAQGISAVFVSELAWRDFFSQILFHFPRVVKESFRPEFDRISWSENEEHFERWKNGMTGFPLIDAGMRQLRATGDMPNRVRMNVASFLCKDLLIHWRKGERYFAGILLDYDLSANNGNWQWAAGTGCDAAPYFRVFNPEIQRVKFDPKEEYIARWIPEWKSSRYPLPMVDHAQASRAAIAAYSQVKQKI